MNKIKCLLMSVSLMLAMLTPAFSQQELELSPPWDEYYREVDALFGEDPDVKIDMNDEDCELTLYVEGQDKADAISSLLPTEQVFGNVTLKVTVVPANEGPKTKLDLIKDAFEGNPAFSYATTINILYANPVSFVVFKNKVVQYFNDDLSDVNGNRSTLYQEIAKEIIGEGDGIYFCTDTPDNIGKPLGEWP